MYSNNYVQSGLVTGTMWDVTLNYFKNQDNSLDLTKTTWGNYNDTTLTECKGRYITVNSSNGSTSDIAQNTDGARHYGIMTTASSEDTKKCNIYDMAGNLWEWTEGIANDLSNNYYMIRGGSFYNTYASRPACYRDYGYASDTSTNQGFRPALFIK